MVKASSPGCRSPTWSPFAHTVYLVPVRRSVTSRLSETELLVTLRIVAAGGPGTSTPRSLTRSSTGTSRICCSRHISLMIDQMIVRLVSNSFRHVHYQLKDTPMRMTFKTETLAKGL